MPLNLLSESIKWKYAIAHIEKISIKKAIISTLRGQVGGIATPNKLGDIPTRALSLKDENKVSGSIMGFISTSALSFVIIAIGAFTSVKYLSLYFPQILNKEYEILLFTSCLLFILLILFPLILKAIDTEKIKSSKIKMVLQSISQTSNTQLLNIVILSFIRYAIFCTQLFFMFKFFDINLSINQALLSIPTIYTLATITPTIPASEAITRSSYAVFILSPFCTNIPSITFATSLVWTLNCGITMIIGSLLFIRKKQNNKNI